MSYEAWGTDSRAGPAATVKSVGWAAPAPVRSP